MDLVTNLRGGSSSLAMVISQHATQTFAALNVTFSFANACVGFDDLVAEPVVCELLY